MVILLVGLTDGALIILELILKPKDKPFSPRSPSTGFRAAGKNVKENKGFP
jgi:hypothetical protein